VHLHAYLAVNAYITSTLFISLLSDDMDLLGDYEEEEYYDRLISFFDDDDDHIDQDAENDAEDDDEEVQLDEKDNLQTVEEDDTDWQLTPGESDASLNFYDDDDNVQSVEDDSLSGFTVKPSTPSLVAGITSKIDVEGAEDSVNDLTAPQSAVTREKLVSDQTSLQTVANNLPL
jgi:hypothetical protein